MNNSETMLGGKNFKIIRMDEIGLDADAGTLDPMLRVHAVKFGDDLRVSKELFEAIKEAIVREKMAMYNAVKV